MAKIYKKQSIEANCLDLAIDRLRSVYDQYDKVTYSFSGGKDSTACLQLGLMVAREKGRLPIDVFTFDEEAIPPQTVEYMERVRNNPDIRFHWFCLPIEHRNACSRSSPFWHPWAPEDRDLWVRPLPDGAITHLDGFERKGIAETVPLIFGPGCGTVANVMGIRCQESMTRYRAVASKKGFHCFTNPMDGAPWMRKIYPIYDWMLEDVWQAPQRFGWDYNRAYDVMEAAGIARNDARCSPPYGEQPIRRLWAYKVCWPELWAKMVERVPGAATAARYSNTELYGIAVQDEDKPAGITWESHTIDTMNKLTGQAKVDVAKAIAALVRQHKSAYRRSGYDAVPIPDQNPDQLSGYSWKSFYVIAAAGGDKFERQRQKVNNVASTVRKKNKICVSTTQISEGKRTGLDRPV